MSTERIPDPGHSGERLSERICACMGGLVFIGHTVDGSEAEEDGEPAELVAAYPCRSCTAKAKATGATRGRGAKH